MQIITESGYDEAVQEVSEAVFDPLSDDGRTSEFSNEVIELAADDDAKQARDMLKDRVADKALFDHPFGDGPLDSTDSRTAIEFGCIVEHGGRVCPRMEERLADDGSVTPAKEAGRLALVVFASDVKRHVFKRVREVVN